jgi:peroxin-7
MQAKGHQGEVFGVEWNHINKRTLLTASNDKTIGLWDAQSLQQGPVKRFVHDHTVYAAIWHPTHDSIFGSCSGDQTCRVWDLRSGKDVKRIHAHQNEILSMDFNKYENFVATAGSDNMIKLWDLRATSDMPIMILTAHTLAVRRIKFSPYHANILASGSYDMSTIVWDCNLQRPMNKFDNHSEFVVGLDFSMIREGYLATASWDKSFGVMRIDENPRSVQMAAGMM